MLAKDLLSKCLKATLIPIEPLTLSEWTERNIVFSSASSSKPGKWDRGFMPYQQGIMDSLTDPNVERIVVVKSAQSGITTSLLIAGMLYYVFHDPAHILYVRPSSEDIIKFSKKELAGIIEGSPKLRGFFAVNKGKEASNTIKTKLFPGGSLTMVGSGSAGALSGFGAKIVLLDECDKFNALPEGSVLDLAETRSKSFSKVGRKLVFISTPSLSDIPNTVEDIYLNQSNMSKFYVPCPHCNHFQVLEWSRVKFGHCKTKLDDVFYTCLGCEGKIYEHQRMSMVRKGYWKADKPEITSFAGFRFSDLYSPFTSLEIMAKQFLSIGRNNLKLMNFVNESLGESWTEKFDDAISEDALFNKREHYYSEVPQGVGILTAGVDIQDDRIEVSILGFGKGEEIFVIDHKIIPGSPGFPEVWQELDKIINKTYKHESGSLVKIDKVCIDSGGHFTDAVYNFSWHKGPRIIPIRGANTYGMPMIPAKGTKAGSKNVLRFDLGTDVNKDTIFSYLKNDVSGQHYVHFPEQLTPDYYKQLTAEVPAYKMVSGKKVRYYKPIRDRNEALDCFVYAYAGFKMVNFYNVLDARVDALNIEEDQSQEALGAVEVVQKVVEVIQTQPRAPEPIPQPIPLVQVNNPYADLYKPRNRGNSWVTGRSRY